MTTAQLIAHLSRRKTATIAIGHTYRSSTTQTTRAAGEDPSNRGKAFVDLASDVTANDVALAARENYVSVEHLKRYTTLGMGVDQGRTSNVNGLAILGEQTKRRPIDEERAWDAGDS